MQPAHQDPLYRAPLQAASGGESRDFAAEFSRVASLHRHLDTVSSPVFHRIGRNRLTRSIDAGLVFIRRYLPPAHWAATRLLAAALYLYLRAVRATAEIVTAGSYKWPDVPEGCVLAIWHGSAPSFLAAFGARIPRTPVKLMVSRDPRGDCVALFCRWLGFEIVRGDAEHGGWKALVEIARDVHNGAAAVISPDGGGPPFVARVGAAALGSAAGVPLIPVGADCHPSFFERHKWDDARNPLPFGRIAVVCGEPILFPAFEDAESLESARKRLQDALDVAARQARQVLGLSEARFPEARKD
jgi:lysophospholipid acyltransferase (LPLAT)-like uncharacterized protein